MSHWKMKLMRLQKVARNEDIVPFLSLAIYEHAHTYAHTATHCAVSYSTIWECLSLFFSLDSSFIWRSICTRDTLTRPVLFHSVLPLVQLVPLTNTYTHAHHRLLELFQRTVFAICCFDANGETTKRSECAKQFKQNFVKILSNFWTFYGYSLDILRILRWKKVLQLNKYLDNKLPSVVFFCVRFEFRDESKELFKKKFCVPCICVAINAWNP